MLALLLNHSTCSLEYMYQDIQHPLFKTVSYSEYSKVYGNSLERLKNFEVYYFSNFTLASKNKSILDEANDEISGETSVTFEIYMNETIEARRTRSGFSTSIDLTKRIPDKNGI